MTPEAALSLVRADESQLPRLFASAGRILGAHRDAADLWEWTDLDRFRVALLGAVPDPWRVIPDLYRYGDALEKRAVLRALDVLPPSAVLAGALVDDALRTNDPRLVAAALGPVGAALLSNEAFGQAVLKVAFLDLDVRHLPGVARRMCPALADQLMGLLREREAARRPIPAGVLELLVHYVEPVTA